MTPVEWASVLVAAFTAGLVNAIAGGGTLITFPVLVAIGMPPLLANVTNSVALCPGYFGGVLAQRRDLVGQAPRLRRLIPAGIFGGIAGGLLLLHSGDRVFESVVPWLIALATGVLAVQPLLRAWVARRISTRANAGDVIWGFIPVAIAAIYGGYFGAGLGMIMLATLGLVVEDTLARLNAVKQLLSLVINGAAVTYFALGAEVAWGVAAGMAVTALAGGLAGGHLASHLKANHLRWLMVAAGSALAVHYFLRMP
jgi:uncharacterized membrane protein YfcA